MNMKKSVLATAVVATLAGPLVNAGTTYVSPDGTGSALLYPYYSVNQGNRSFINITNTTTDAKVVKVRFRDGVGSRDIFDFTLFLSGGDHWVGAIRRDAEQVTINTPDNSCTVPTVKGSNAPFNPLRFDDAYIASSDPDRLSEGHVEVLEMATLEAGSTEDQPVYFGITHDSSGIPGGDETCAASTSWEAGMAGQAAIGNNAINVTHAWSTTGQDVGGGSNIQGLLPATGGLAGFAATFNPNDGTWFTSQATALKGYNEGLKFFVQDDTAWSGLNDFTTDFGLTADGGDVEYFDLPDLSTQGADDTYNARVHQSDGTTAQYGWTAGADADNMRDSVTASLMKGLLASDYITSEGFETELVATFPTRYLHLDVVDEDGNISGVEPATVAPNAEPPFTVNELNTTGEACHTVGFSYRDREEQRPTVAGGVEFSPGGSVPDAFQLCFEVNVMAFNQTAGTNSSVLQSGSVAKYVGLDTGFENGWFALNLTDFNLTGDTGGALDGLPLLAFLALKDTSTAVPRGATVTIPLKPAE